METLEYLITYIFGIIQLLFDFILDNWLLTLMLGLEIIYLSICAIKFLRNTDD